jgi:hypothetical protein
VPAADVAATEAAAVVVDAAVTAAGVVVAAVEDAAAVAVTVVVVAEVAAIANSHPQNFFQPQRARISCAPVPVFVAPASRRLFFQKTAGRKSTR